MKIRLEVWCLLMAAAIAASGCAGMKEHNLPPAERLFAPGPGVTGPGPGVLPPAPVAPAGYTYVTGGGGYGAGAACPPMVAGFSNSVQIFFNRPDSMHVQWDVGGIGQFDSEPLIVPGRKSFPEGGIYRLKITNIANREGLELYPSLEVGPTSPRTAAYLAHSAIPVQFTEEDLDQVVNGNFVTKVVYLPDPEFQEMALAGVETLVSTRLDPGMDPIVEADRRGSIMVVIRIGNKDVELPGSNGDPVIAAGYVAQAQAIGGDALPMGMTELGPTGITPAYVSGLTAPQWGMPMSGTPIGLPGPPHVPFGSPAGLQKHVMRNHTPMHLPGPTKKVKMHVRQSPGYSYPKPASRVFIREQMIHPAPTYQQPHNDYTHVITDGSGHH